MNGSSRKILCVSRVGCLTDFCRQLRNEGNQVRYYIESKTEKDTADGFVEKVDDWTAHKEWADLIIFDDSDFGPICEKLRKEGKAVVGGTVYTDRLEMDRDFGQQEMKAVGMTILPHWDFSGFDEALQFVKANPGRYVVKPSGEAQAEKVLSFVGQEEDGLDVVAMLERYKVSWAKKIHRFQVQKYAPGVEVAIGAYFNGKDFILPACVNFEHKKMCNGDIGPSTGEMGTAMFFAGENELYRATLAKMKDRLAAVGYVGYFDINCIASPRAIHPLEFTPRFGYPTLSIQMEGVQSRWGDFMHALGKGEPFALKTQRGFQLGVVVAVPPFPFEDPKAFKKYSEDAVVIFKKPATAGVCPADVKLVDGDWRLAGSTGYALVVTGSGPTMEDAQREAYARVKNIIIPNMFYRTDIGARWQRDGDLLRTWGYL